MVGPLNIPNPVKTGRRHFPQPFLAPYACKTTEPVHSGQHVPLHHEPNGGVLKFLNRDDEDSRRSAERQVAQAQRQVIASREAGRGLALPNPAIAESWYIETRTAYKGNYAKELSQQVDEANIRKTQEEAIRLQEEQEILQSCHQILSITDPTNFLLNTK